jgi:polynucleotide 5'-kinase involved in rRNA processing
MEERPYASLRERLHGMSGSVLIIGGPDTGKTTIGRLLVEDAIADGISAAYVDGDIGVSTVGPPACVGMRRLKSAEDIADWSNADELRFVGSTATSGVVLPYVVAVSSLVDVARREAELVVLDTSGDIVGGVVGQTIVYHLMELCRPSIVVAMHRGQEMEPVVGMLRRFLSARVAMAEPLPEVVPLAPMERRQLRIDGFAAALPPPLPRWRVQTKVFAPTLPEEFDSERLDGMLVGVQDDHGHCLGLGALEVVDGVVRVATAYGEEMRGLRLGSLRIDLDTFDTARVRLRELIFGL